MFSFVDRAVHKVPRTCSLILTPRVCPPQIYTMTPYGLPTGLSVNSWPGVEAPEVLKQIMKSLFSLSRLHYFTHLFCSFLNLFPYLFPLPHLHFSYPQFSFSSYGLSCIPHTSLHIFEHKDDDVKVQGHRLQAKECLRVSELRERHVIDLSLKRNQPC